jgi:hypothetical protein
MCDRANAFKIAIAASILYIICSVENIVFFDCEAARSAPPFEGGMGG